MSRFTISEGVRGALPLFIGLCGPSGSGKTFSALRLATGIQKVCGGHIAVIDTEANRALHYSSQFKFLHVPFAPPFSPADYWEAIKVCIDAGAKTIVIDSMSHEHEGPGGVLEMHEAETQRIMKSWNCSQEVAQFPAWAMPKSERRKLLNNTLQVHVNLIECFRAKRKVKMVRNERGKNVPTDQGWMPIAGDEYAYEMAALAVLPPGSKGVPEWLTNDPGTEMIIKRPAMFESILKENAQLSEEMGAAMATWAKGAPINIEPGSKLGNLIALIAAANTKDALEEARAVANKTEGLTKPNKELLREKFAAAEARINAANPETDGP